MTLKLDLRAVSAEKPSHAVSEHDRTDIQVCTAAPWVFDGSGRVRGGHKLWSCRLMEILPACTSPPGCPPQAERPRCWVGLRNPPLPSYEGSGDVVDEKMAIGEKIKS